MPVPQLTLRTEKGSDLTYGELDNNFRKLKDFCDGLEQRVNVSIGPDGAVDTTAILNAIESKLSLKVGDYIYSAALLNDDQSRLLCNGQEVSRDIYGDLFAAVGSTYGAAASSSNFKVPNFSARFPLAVGVLQSGSVVALGGTGGEQNHALIKAEMPDHDHGIANGALVQCNNGTQNGPLVTVAGSPINLPASLWIAQGGNATHNNMPPWIGVYVYIRTGLAP